jgi:hypothetical protein
MTSLRTVRSKSEVESGVIMGNVSGREICLNSQIIARRGNFDPEISHLHSALQ